MTTYFKHQGTIIIIVLWALFFLASLAVALRSYVWPQIEAANRLKARAVMYYAAKAGIKRAVTELSADETDAYDALNDSWASNEEVFKDVELGNGGYSLSYTLDSGAVGYGLLDEERKISINKADEQLLTNLFEVIGKVSSSEAQELADCVMDWRDNDDNPRDDGAESEYYLNLDTPYECSNAEFEVLEEVLLVKGVTQKIFDNIKDKITLYGAVAVNINTADELVLRALGMEDDLVKKIISFRKGADAKTGTEDDQIFEDVGTLGSAISSKVSMSIDDVDQLHSARSAGWLGVGSNYFGASCMGRVKNSPDQYRIYFVFDRGNNVIKYWREW